jgi:anthranilate phosphoribosyltransferase
VKNQVVGVFDGAWCEPLARAFGQLGARRAFVVHGEGGIDEVAVSGRTRVAEWDGGEVRSYEVTPRDFGLEEEDPDGLRGGDADDNARTVRAVLDGQSGAPRAAAVMEAALALMAAGAAADPEEGAYQAGRALDDGRARRTLERWARMSRDED